METVGGKKLTGCGGAYLKAIELVKNGGRPITIGFIMLSSTTTTFTTTDDLEFHVPNSGFLFDNQNQVVANMSGLPQPARGDRLVAIDGEKIEDGAGSTASEVVLVAEVFPADQANQKRRSLISSSPVKELVNSQEENAATPIDTSPPLVAATSRFSIDTAVSVGVATGDEGVVVVNETSRPESPKNAAAASEVVLVAQAFPAAKEPQGFFFSSSTEDFGTSQQGDSEEIGGGIQEWIQCDRCDKWRKLPMGETAASLHLEDTWHCGNSSWDWSGSCSVPEELWFEENEDQRSRSHYDSAELVTSQQGVEEIGGDIQEWIQCDRCDKWRKLPMGETAASLHLEDTWHCGNSSWDWSGSCSVPEEEWSEESENDKNGNPSDSADLTALCLEVAMLTASAQKKNNDLGLSIDHKRPVRIAFQDTSERRFEDDSERVRTALVPTEVMIDHHEQTSSFSNGVAFEWAHSEFYAIAFENEGGKPCITNKELSVRFEIWDISGGESTAMRIYSTTSNKTWQRKYFWFSAVNFLQTGSYLLRFSPACKKYAHLKPIECCVRVRSSFEEATHKRMRAQRLIEMNVRNFHSHLSKHMSKLSKQRERRSLYFIGDQGRDLPVNRKFTALGSSSTTPVSATATTALTSTITTDSTAPTFETIAEIAMPRVDQQALSGGSCVTDDELFDQPVIIVAHPPFTADMASSSATTSTAPTTTSISTSPALEAATVEHVGADGEEEVVVGNDTCCPASSENTVAASEVVLGAHAVPAEEPSSSSSSSLSLESALARAESFRDELAQELDEVGTKWNAMAQKRNDLAKKKDELENDRDEMAKQRDEIVKQRDELAKERDELAKGRDEVTNERDEMVKELDKLKKERSQMGKKCEAALAHAEMLDSMVPTLEAMRSEMKRLLLQSKSALLEAGVPKRQKTDESVPYWYGEHSWAGREDIPWNEGEKRAMTPSEGIQWLSLELQTAKKGAPSKKRSSTSRAQVDNHYGLLASSPGR